MSAWITECHLRAPAVRVARQLFGLLGREAAPPPKGFPTPPGASGSPT